MVAPTTDMSSLVLKKSPYPLILKAQPASKMVMNANQDGLDNGGHGLA